MNLIYKPKHGEKIVFDHYVASENEHWACVCENCFKRYQEEFSEAAVKDAACENDICGIEGCAEDGRYYIDFTAEQVFPSTRIRVSMQKTVSYSEVFDATPEEMELIKNNQNPFFGELQEYIDENCEEEYDWSVTNEETDEVLVEWC